MKSRYIVLVAIVSIAIGACAPSGNQPKGGGTEFSLRLSGEGVDGAALRSEIGALRVISSANNYNQLATKEGEVFKFTLPTRQKQTLFLVANEKTDLAALVAASFNQAPLNTADYFLNNGMDDPKLYVADRQMDRNTSAEVFSLEMQPTYAKLSLEITDIEGGSREITGVEIKNVPTQFTLGGVKTHYPPTQASDTERGADAYTEFTLTPNSRSCYLPEHDPADINKRTTVKITTSDGKTFYSVVKEPYSSVDDGKIVRGKHYKMRITLPS